MAGQGVINIGLNVDYQESLQKMTKDFKSEMSRLSNELKKIEISKDVEKQFEVINERINELSETVGKTFSQLNAQKLDSSNFEQFQVKIKKSFNTIENNILDFRTQLTNLGQQDVADGLKRQFDGLSQSILSTYDNLEKVFEISKSFGTPSSAMVKEYEKTAKQVSQILEGISSGTILDSLYDDESAITAERLNSELKKLEDQYDKIKGLERNMFGVDSSTPAYSVLENELASVGAEAQKTAIIIQELNDTLNDVGSAYSKNEDTNKSILGQIDFVSSIEATERLEKFVEKAKELKHEYQEVTTLQVKNGAIQVPVEVATKSGALKEQVQELINKVQSYVDTQSIITKVKLVLDESAINPNNTKKKTKDSAPDSEVNLSENIEKTVQEKYTRAFQESENAARETIKTIQDIFNSSPIEVRVNKEAFINELTETVNEALGKVAENETKLNVNEQMTQLVASLRETSAALTGTEGFKLGLDEASINRITSSIENMANMIKRALGVASDNDIANQWSVIEDKFKSAAGEEGKLLAKNKEHKVAMQELAVEYKKYLDMGGEKTFSDLSSHRYTVQNLTKAYEDLGKSVQETTQKQEKQKTTQKTSKADSEAIRSTTRANKSLETQADKTSTSIKNEANSAQSASEKFRKLAKEKGNATIANRELAKAAKETADALGREVKARKEAENSRGSKNAVDSGVYNANALDWQIDIKQKLLDSGNYAEIYGAQISQLANGNVQFVASVRAMVDGVDDEWKKLTAVVDGNGNVVSRKFKDLSDKQIKDIEKAKEQARRATEALAQLMNGEETEAVSYDRDTMEQLVTDAVKATQAMEGLDAKYKATLNNSGGITIIKTLTEANGVVKTFTAEFDDVKTVINAANSSVEEFSTLMNEAFDRAKVSISTKSVKADTSDTETVISHYEEMYEVIKKINDLDVKISGLDDKKNVNQLSLLRNELKETAAEYLRLTDILNQKGGIDSFSSEELDKLLDLYEKASEKIEKIKAKLADGFVAKGYSALDSFNKKYSGYDGYGEYADDIARITEEIKTLSSQEGLDSVKKKLQDIGQELSNIKTNNANEIKLGTIIGDKSFSDINELRSNIVSLMSNIGEVNEKSIKIKGAKSLSAEVKKTNGEIHNMTVNLDNNGFAHYVDNGIAEFKRLGSAAESVFNGVKDLVRIYLSPQDFIRYFRQGFDAVTEVDTALTELIKVSDASDNAIAEYFDGAIESAKELGSSVTDMISATSEWARLGYNLPDSKKLGEVAVLYKNVGDGIDIDAANESLVSTLQGFQLEPDDAISIVDKFNEVSNNFAISSGSLGEALKRSAAAFNAANTDLSGAIALITTGNEVVQSPEKVGTMWQTVSARIRGKFCAHCTVMCRPLYEDNILVA